MLNHVKCEVVSATTPPDGQEQKNPNAKGRQLQKEQHGRDDGDQKKQAAFQPDRLQTFEVLHNSIMSHRGEPCVRGHARNGFNRARTEDIR